MPIARVGQLAKNDVVTQQGQLPASWMMATYGPGFPVQPFVSPEETKIPREIDYPISVNASLQPRIGYGLEPFSSLKAIYETITEVRMPVSMSLRQLTGFKPHLVDSQGNEIDGHPYQWICESPDRVTPFDVWLTRFMKSSDIFDAGVYFKQRANNKLVSLNYLDGSTIFIIVNDKGNVPLPDEYDRNVVNTTAYIEKLKKFNTAHPGMLARDIRKQADRTQLKTPAYAQVIKGTPFAWYAQDEIWYKPRSRRYDSPYGETFIEQAWVWIMIIANITGFELAYYRTGNTPEGLLVAADGWSLEKQSAWEAAFNARMTGHATERMRTRVIPSGFSWTNTKKPDFPKELYQKAFDNLVMSFGYPISEFGQISGRALGGKDVGDLLQDKAFRDAIIPRKVYFENAINAALAYEGVDDASLQLALPMLGTDPAKEREGIFDGVAHGVFTLNDALGRMNLDPVEDSVDIDPETKEITPIPDHIANKHIIIAGSSVYVLEDMQAPGGVGQPALKPGGVAPEVDAANGQQTGEVEPKTQDQFAQAREAVRQIFENVQEGGTLDTRTISIPSASKMQLEKKYDIRRAGAKWEVFNADTGKSVPGGKHKSRADAVAHMRALYANVPDASKAASPYAVPSGTPNEGTPAGVDADEFSMGMQEEQEHADTVGHEQTIIRNIVLDHLREDPHYYTHLKEVHVDKAMRKSAISNALLKHCGVCPEDSAYFGAPIIRDWKFDFPTNHHVNDVEIVAMAPEGLPPVPAIWKPEGGELDVLRERVGGPLYVREEAAYLLDRSLGFMLVPVAYVADVDDEMGAALFYSIGSTPSEDISSYAPEWIERAAVVDYIMSQQDRHPGNFLTHPDDPTRPILIDNSLGFPTNDELYCASPFCEAMVNKPLSPDVMKAMQVCYDDAAAWQDITDLVGQVAVSKARDECLARLLQLGMVTHYETPPQTNTEVSGENGQPDDND